MYHAKWLSFKERHEHPSYYIIKLFRDLVCYFVCIAVTTYATLNYSFPHPVHALWLEHNVLHNKIDKMQKKYTFKKTLTYFNANSSVLFKIVIGCYDV